MGYGSRERGEGGEGGRGGGGEGGRGEEVAYLEIF